MLCVSPLFSHHTSPHPPLPTPDMWGFPPQGAIFCGTSWVSYDLIQFQPSMETDSVRSTRQGLSPTRLSPRPPSDIPPFATYVSDPPAIDQRLPPPPPQVQFARADLGAQRNFFLTRFPVYYKRIRTQEAPDGRKTQGEI